ncbi:hypothetical protein RB195_019763 [Necator americanus]|uniref:Uncharacterized protein n=2 Tax=Necator americanus TaxID=51031 RepID=A0ABR1CGG1_NECAM|nr:hypothetical protein NECAME_09637 [Necator americanus]ETN79770.1 hypothetical protein NECAME_09637 [Necator americanus]
MNTFLLLALVFSVLLLSHASPALQTPLTEEQLAEARDAISNRVKRWGGWGCCGGGFGFPGGFGGGSYGNSYGMSSSYSMNAYNGGYNNGFFGGWGKR